MGYLGEMIQPNCLDKAVKKIRCNRLLKAYLPIKTFTTRNEYREWENP